MEYVMEYLVVVSALGIIVGTVVLVIYSKEEKTGKALVTYLVIMLAVAVLTYFVVIRTQSQLKELTMEVKKIPEEGEAIMVSAVIFYKKDKPTKIELVSNTTKLVVVDKSAVTTLTPKK